MPTLRQINAEFRASYLDQESIYQNLQNCLSHQYTLTNVIDYKNMNFFLSANQTYNASQVNFLFLATNLDVQLIIDGDKQFSVTEFILVQRDYSFSFEIKPIIIPSGCNVNIHCMHGKLLMS